MSMGKDMAETRPCHREKLSTLSTQMQLLGLMSPLMWISTSNCEDMCEDKLHDLMNFAPSHWDGVICSLVVISRGVVMNITAPGAISAALLTCQDFLMSCLRSNMTEPECPLLSQYAGVIQHLIHATRVMVVSLYSDMSIIDAVRSLGVTINSFKNFNAQDRSAVLAARSLTLQICHYTKWPSLMDESKHPFTDAMQSAACALALHPLEGYWSTLYARCLPPSHSEKSILLQAGVRLRHSPFTVMEYASYLSRLGHVQAVEEAARLCQFAIQRWPGSVYVNCTYVTLFLSTNCRSLLDETVAQVCLRSARRFAPNSPLLAGRAWSLRDVRRAAGHLSPILEERGDNDVDVGDWDETKEARLRSIAARLYPEHFPTRASPTVSTTIKTVRVDAYTTTATAGTTPTSTAGTTPTSTAGPKSTNDLWSPPAPKNINKKAVPLRRVQTPLVSSATSATPIVLRTKRTVGPLRRPRQSDTDSGHTSSGASTESSESSSESAEAPVAASVASTLPLPPSATSRCVGDGRHVRGTPPLSRTAMTSTPGPRQLPAVSFLKPSVTAAPSALPVMTPAASLQSYPRTTQRNVAGIVPGRATPSVTPRTEGLSLCGPPATLQPPAVSAFTVLVNPKTAAPSSAPPFVGPLSPPLSPTSALPSTAPDVVSSTGSSVAPTPPPTPSPLHEGLLSGRVGVSVRTTAQKRLCMMSEASKTSQTSDEAQRPLAVRAQSSEVTTKLSKKFFLEEAPKTVTRPEESQPKLVQTPNATQSRLAAKLDPAVLAQPETKSPQKDPSVEGVTSTCSVAPSRTLRPEPRVWTRSRPFSWNPETNPKPTQLDTLLKAEEVPLWRRGGKVNRVAVTAVTPVTVDTFSSWRKNGAASSSPQSSRRITCNCVCNGVCAFLTFKYYGTLRPPTSELPCCRRGISNEELSRELPPGL